MMAGLPRLTKGSGQVPDNEYWFAPERRQSTESYLLSLGNGSLLHDAADISLWTRVVVHDISSVFSADGQTLLTAASAFAARSNG
jgi:hypothetical protein